MTGLVAKCVLVGLLFASSSAAFALCPNPREAPHPVNEFFWDPFEPPLGRSHVDRDAEKRILALFGEPDNVARKRVYERDEPKVDTIIESWTYERGISFVLVGFQENRLWLEQIAISSSTIELKLGITIGMTWADYWSHMGWEEPAADRVSGSTVYCDEYNTEHYIELHPRFEGGLLAALVWKHVRYRQ